MVVTKIARGETQMVSRLVMLYLYDNGTIDPCALDRGH
jgi:hypothetical protein